MGGRMLVLENNAGIVIVKKMITSERSLVKN